MPPVPGAWLCGAHRPAGLNGKATFALSPVAGTATAQGCPFGPLSLVLWMGAGHAATAEARPPEETAGCTRVYMDDRSFTATTAQALLSKMSRWRCWSKENLSKSQLTATKAQDRECLARLAPDPQVVMPDLEILGCTSHAAARRLAPKEEARLQARG